MDLSQFHEDHQFLRRQVNTLDSLTAQSDDSAEHTAQLHAALHVLRARLALHLAIEDRFLYPQVEAADRSDTQGVTHALRHELGHLDQSLTELVERFDDAAAIDEAPEQFRLRLHSLLGSLEQRMAQEEAQLFPIAAAL